MKIATIALDERMSLYVYKHNETGEIIIGIDGAKKVRDLDHVSLNIANIGMPGLIGPGISIRLQEAIGQEIHEAARNALQ